MNKHSLLNKQAFPHLQAICTYLRSNPEISSLVDFDLARLIVNYVKQRRVIERAPFFQEKTPEQQEDFYKELGRAFSIAVTERIKVEAISDIDVEEIVEDFCTTIVKGVSLEEATGVPAKAFESEAIVSNSSNGSTDT